MEIGIACKSRCLLDTSVTSLVKIDFAFSTWLCINSTSPHVMHDMVVERENGEIFERNYSVTTHMTGFKIFHEQKLERERNFGCKFN